METLKSKIYDSTKKEEGIPVPAPDHMVSLLFWDLDEVDVWG